MFKQFVGGRLLVKNTRCFPRSERVALYTGSNLHIFILCFSSVDGSRVQASMVKMCNRVGPKDVSLLERCPHFVFLHLLSQPEF